MSGNNRPPIGLARVARYMRGDAKKGKQRSKGKKPTYAKTGA